MAATNDTDVVTGAAIFAALLGIGFGVLLHNAGVGVLVFTFAWAGLSSWGLSKEK